jgi:outer membrane protein
MKFDENDQVNIAMNNRFELAEAQLQVDSAAVTLGVAKNNLLPELDLTGSVGPQGAGPDETTAIRTNFDFNHIDASLGLKLQIPLGNRAARAILERSNWLRLQAIEKYKSVISTVSFDVDTGTRGVRTAWDVLNNARRSRYDAESYLKDINDRERNNEPLTPEFVDQKLRAQESLAEANQFEAQAIANYNIALATLERNKGTLLRYNNVVIQEDATHYKEMGLLH